MHGPGTPDGSSPYAGKLVAGRYRIVRFLGGGGTGAVFEAKPADGGESVAIKCMHLEVAATPDMRARFEREVRAATAIRSPHIVQVLDAGVDGDQPFIVMELLSGEDLRKRLRQTGALGVRESLRIITWVLEGLRDAHAAGILHRDLKPDNVLLVRDAAGELANVKIVDFGTSKFVDGAEATALAITGAGRALGTPHYMAPEQAEGRSDVDARADLYGVGAILFECLAGRRQDGGPDAPDVRAYNEHVPLEVAAFVKRALARSREQRFASAEAMLAELYALCEALGGARSGFPSENPERPATSRPPPRARSVTHISVAPVVSLAPDVAPVPVVSPARDVARVPVASPAPVVLMGVLALVLLLLGWFVSTCG